MVKEILFNKKALFDFEPLEKLEAGLILTGAEVKSLRAGRADLKGAYVMFDKASAPIIVNFYIAPYPPAKREQQNYNPTRQKKLLLNKQEIGYLIGKQKERGLTIIPLKMYNKNNFIKVEIGICRGKKKFDKREAIKKKEIKRKIEREMRRRV